MPEAKDTPATLGQSGVIKIGASGLPVSANSPSQTPATTNVGATPAPTASPTVSPVESIPPKESSTPKMSQDLPGVNLPTTPVKAPDIYAMPKEFQHHNRVAGGNSRLMGALVVLGSLVFLIIIGGGFFMYIFNPGLLSTLTGQFIGSNVVTLPPDTVELAATGSIPTEGLATTTASTTSPTETPQVVYFKFLKELSAINTFEDYYILVSKYGNGRKISAVESERLLAETTPEANKASVKAIKEKAPGITSPSEAGSIKEDVTDQNALLYITLANNKATGTIAFTLENNVWKIGDENWPLTSATPATIQYTMGEDRDGDGLLDKEEDLLGSNKDSTDSDGDGYGDLSETLSLYNPAGKNKLVDNTSIKSYLAEDKSFSLLYPSKWTRAFNSKDQSVIFRSADDHFIQLMIENNDKQATLDDYVKDLLNITTIKDSLRRTGDAWRGIMTEDGLQIYVMDSKNQKIYILRYSPSENNILEYPNIFQIMIKSLVIKK